MPTHQHTSMRCTSTRSKSSACAKAAQEQAEFDPNSAQPRQRHGTESKREYRVLANRTRFDRSFREPLMEPSCAPTAPSETEFTMRNAFVGYRAAQPRKVRLQSTPRRSAASPRPTDRVCSPRE